MLIVLIQDAAAKHAVGIQAVTLTVGRQVHAQLHGLIGILDKGAGVAGALDGVVAGGGEIELLRQLQIPLLLLLGDLTGAGLGVAVL